MPIKKLTETEQTAPTDREVDAQIEKLSRDPLMQGELRVPLLRFLIGLKRDGRFSGQQRATSGKDVLEEFYDEIGVTALEDARKKLAGALAAALKRFYAADGPGANDRVIITIWTGKGHAYEPLSEYRSESLNQFSPEAPLSAANRRGITIAPKWESDLVKDTMREAGLGSELRVQTTYFLNTGRMIETFSIALSNGANVRVLLTDPDSPLLRARFRLRRDGQNVDNIKHLIRSQLHDLHLLKENNPGAELGASIEFKVTDIMPFGFFVQGKSEKDGDWMRIGLMPATVTYMDGPMISLTPDVTELWKVLENTWRQTWAFPRDPLQGHDA